jgi:hypothetical protein
MAMLLDSLLATAVDLPALAKVAIGVASGALCWKAVSTSGATRQDDAKSWGGFSELCVRTLSLLELAPHSIVSASFPRDAARP